MFRTLFFIVMLWSAAGFAQLSEHLWAGANQYQLWYQPRQRITNQLDAMQDAGLKVLRIFLGARPEYFGWEDPPEPYSFEPQLGQYNDALLENVDYLMAECKKRGILLIVALENANFNAPYEDTFGVLGQYTSGEAMQTFKNRFSYFLNHENKLLGKPWKDLDEVILAWEISNEPGIKLDQITSLRTEEKTDVLRNWLAGLADHLKSIDPNTFVSLGIAGYDRYYQKGIGDDIIALGNIENADIYTLHFYGGNLAGWFEDVLPVVRSWGKLLILQEFGETRGQGEEKIKGTYQYVTRTCYEYGVPWMFWRLGHRKDGGTWSIMEDDAVWQEVVEPRARKINRKLTPDEWTVYEKSAAAIEVWEPFENAHPRYWSCWEKSTPFYDDASACYFSSEYTTQGDSALVCEFSPAFSTKDEATFFTTRMGPYDWDLIESLQLDIYNTVSETIRFEMILSVGPDRNEIVRISEQGADMQPGWNRDRNFSPQGIEEKGWINKITFRVTGYGETGAIHIDNMRLSDTRLTSVKEKTNQSINSVVPMDFELAAYPNPFIHSTHIRAEFDTPPPQFSAAVYNVLGQKVTTLQPIQTTASRMSFIWRGQNESGKRMPAGIYILRAEIKGRIVTQKLSLIRP